MAPTEEKPKVNVNLEPCSEDEAREIIIRAFDRNPALGKTIKDPEALDEVFVHLSERIINSSTVLSPKELDRLADVTLKV
jgi:hypothetical protein